MRVVAFRMASRSSGILSSEHAAPSTDYLSSKGVAEADMAKFKDLGSDEFPTSDVESAYTSYAMIQAVMLKKKKRRGKK